MKKLTHKLYGGEYDYDETTGRLTTELKLYGDNDRIRFETFEYEYNEDSYIEIEYNE